MNTTENLTSTGGPAIAPQPINQIIKPIKFPAQPQEWKIVSLRECPMPANMERCETPDEAAAYWRAHIPNHPYFKEEQAHCMARSPSLNGGFASPIHFIRGLGA